MSRNGNKAGRKSAIRRRVQQATRSTVKRARKGDFSGRIKTKR